LIEQAVILGLAAWRLTALVSYERGPGDMFRRLRAMLGFQHDSGGRPTAWPSGALQEMIACPWCLGLYAAALCYGLWQITPLIPVVLAASTVLIVVEKWNNG